MLDEELLPISRSLGGENWIFQQDNAAIHVSKKCKEWFSSKNVNLLSHPARSPDLNPIENLWSTLSRKVYKDGQFDSVEELKKTIIKCWNLIEDEECQKLITLMKNRICQVLINKGGSTTY